MADDKGTAKSYTLELVKEMGHNPIMISVLDTDEVFIFETKTQAEEAEDDFSPEGIWAAEEELPDLKQQGLGKVIDLRVKAAPAETIDPTKGATVSFTKDGVEVKMTKEEALTKAIGAFKSYVDGGVFVFSGFRSSILESNIQKLGGKVEDRVTKRTTCLVMKDVSKDTNKRRVAEKYKKEIMSLEELNKIMTNEVVKATLGI